MNKVPLMTKQRKVLRTTNDVITAFGGTNAAAREWDVSPPRVSQWRSDGIPAGFHCRMEHALEARGYIVDLKRLGWL